jgi:hypothetical protein
LRLLFEVLSDISLGILSWYGRAVKGFLVAGDSITSLNEEKDTVMLCLIEGVERISMVARQELVRPFYERVTRSSVFREYMQIHGFLPKVYFLVLSPKEMEYHIPKVLYYLKSGITLFDREGILAENLRDIDQNLRDMRVLKVRGVELLDLKVLKRREVEEI